MERDDAKNISSTRIFTPLFPDQKKRENEAEEDNLIVKQEQNPLNVLHKVSKQKVLIFFNLTLSFLKTYIT